MKNLNCQIRNGNEQVRSFVSLFIFCVIMSVPKNFHCRALCNTIFLIHNLFCCWELTLAYLAGGRAIKCMVAQLLVTTVERTPDDTAPANSSGYYMHCQMFIIDNQKLARLQKDFLVCYISAIANFYMMPWKTWTYPLFAKFLVAYWFCPAVFNRYRGCRIVLH